MFYVHFTALVIHHKKMSKVSFNVFTVLDFIVFVSGRLDKRLNVS